MFAEATRACCLARWQLSVHVNCRFYFTNPRDMDAKSYLGGCMNTCVLARSRENKHYRLKLFINIVLRRKFFYSICIFFRADGLLSYMGAFVSSWVRFSSHRGDYDLVVQSPPCFSHCNLLYTHIYMYMYIYVYIHIFVYTHILYTHIYVCTYICMHTHVSS